jgi:hypothetical protein
MRGWQYLRKPAWNGAAELGDAEVRIVPFTPEALAKRAQIAAIYGWFRQRAVLIVVALMLFFQFLTWRAVDKMADGMSRNPPRCSEYDPCTVYVKGTVSLDSNSRR